MLSPFDCARIEANLFPSARWLVRERPYFPWHCDQGGDITAGHLRSSQALAIDLFGTIDRLRSRDAILGRIAKEVGLPSAGPWSIELEALVPRELLGESRQTQIDALGKGAQALILFECKFSEPDGGSCSQPVPIRKGPNKGLRQCNGSYQHQLNQVSQTTARCALATKGVRYWNLIPSVLQVDPNVDHIPCPFAGGWYQWMRNLVAAAAMSHEADAAAAVTIAYADGPFPMAKKVRYQEWAEFIHLVRSTVLFRAISYQALAALALEAAHPADRSTLSDCRDWIDHKIAAAST